MRLANGRAPSSSLQYEDRESQPKGEGGSWAGNAESGGTIFSYDQESGGTVWRLGVRSKKGSQRFRTYRDHQDEQRMIR